MMQYNYLKKIGKVSKIAGILLVCCMINITIAQAKDVDFAWAKGIGGMANDRGVSIATDKDGNVYTLGYVLGKVDLDPGPDSFYVVGDSTVLLVTATSFVAQYKTVTYVSKFDAAGNFIWATVFRGSGHLPKSITVDDFGVYFTGNFIEFKYDNITIGSANKSGVIVAKLDTAGNFMWAKKSENLVNSGGGTGMSIATDTLGDVYITGRYAGKEIFGTDTLIFNSITSSLTDFFISKLDSSGNFLWSKSIGGDGNDWANGIVSDDIGNIYVTGTFSQTVDFDPGPGIYSLTANNETQVRRLWKLQVGQKTR
jgi:hypothetical protein